MKQARIVIGANYGDEGKGTVVAHYAKHAGRALNILTNGGAQRGHSILTEEGSMTFRHFGSGTFHGADNYYSCFFILNPMQFVREYNSLIVKPKHIYRDSRCRWSTPYDSMVNLFTEQAMKRHSSCGMGIWNTIKRFRTELNMLIDSFLSMSDPISYLDSVKRYYEESVDIPHGWHDIWNSKTLQQHFVNDCRFLVEHTELSSLCALSSVTDGYDDFIFENGQGLLLCDTGRDTYDTTPTNTGSEYALTLIEEMKGLEKVTAHYVTRPYLTRHGDGHLPNQSLRSHLSSTIGEDRTNHYNDFQGEFRYGKLDIHALKNRIVMDMKGVENVDVEVELTHCDEMDRVSEFRKMFEVVNVYDSPLV